MAELVFLVAPVFFDLNKEFKEDALLKEFLDVLASLDTNMLEFLALVANDNALLTVALHIDYRHDVNRLVVLVKLLNNDLCGIWHLFVVGEQYLLAHKKREFRSVRASLPK